MEATDTPSPGGPGGSGSDPTINPIDGTSMAGAQKAVIQAGLALYEAALYLRNTSGITQSEAEQYLLAPMNAVTTVLKRKMAEAKLPAIEKRQASVIQTAHDPAADFLRDANREGGVNIHVKQFEDKQ